MGMNRKNHKKLTASEIMRLIKSHKKMLAECNVKRIGLFGSYARGEQKQNSDIDFLVEFKKPSFDSFMDLAFGLEKLFGKKVELITKGSLSPHIRPYVEKEIKWHAN